jgi:tetratricopeptide (TPR) repeat protein
MAQMILRDYLQETEDAISRGQLDNALARCQSILASYPESLDAQRLLGEVYLAQGRLDDAQQAFDWVLTNDPENVVAYCDRALISERLSDYDTALDCYQQAYELSRGNSQIRQAFNKLSAKAGQQGFMFSRAGLARLYMRGDLLTQAIQEWEAVLAVNSDRLDARTGLLEAYWHERLYNQVELQAKQILQDVPGCVKALLLLAYVISARDMLQARELLHKVEALDPDLILAHDLLADAMASHPNDPFLQLLRKPPVTIDTALEHSAISDISSQDTRLQEAGMNALPAFAQSGSGFFSAPNAQIIPDWTSVDASPWNNIAGLKDLDESLAGQDVPTLPWSSNTYTGSEVWNGANNSAGEQKMPDFVAQLGDMNFSSDGWGAPSQEAASQGTNTQDEAAQAEPWMALQETLGNPGPAGPADVASNSRQADRSGAEMPDTLSWNQQSAFSELTFDGAWGSGQDAKETNMSGEWTGAMKDDQPAPPAWLSMLTQNDRKQMNGDLSPLASPPQDPIPSAPSASVEQRPPAQPEPRRQGNRQAEPPMFAPAVDLEESEDESLFGPEWLKSLGAASMEAALSAQMPVVRATSPQPPSSERKAPSQPLPRADREPWSPAEQSAPASLSAPVTPSQEALPSVVSEVREAYASGIPEASPWPGEKDGQDVLATLEALEQELRLQGFRQLEPNTLAAIARDKGEIDKAGIGEGIPEQPGIPYREPSLSSALAELGDIDSQKLEQEAEANVYEMPAQPGDMTTSAPSPDISWFTASDSILAPPGQQERLAPTAETYAEVPAPPVSTPQPVSSADVAEEKTVRADPMKTPVARMSAFLENELEITMRRPAVRVPPGGQRSGGQRTRSAPPARNLSPRREDSSATNAAVSNINPNERLLRGYQHQLVGDYDEAMQEYRVIIRNSPELLGEVVSNVRALLKLAPKYAPGYRVLGDAYMRQGEYLQAMEAYNKALTMAKRAKA